MLNFLEFDSCYMVLLAAFFFPINHDTSSPITNPIGPIKMLITGHILQPGYKTSAPTRAKLKQTIPRINPPLNILVSSCFCTPAVPLIQKMKMPHLPVPRPNWNY